MLIYCAHCGGRHKRGERCAKAPQRRGMRMESDAVSFRNTQRWKDKAEAIKERDLHLCRWCLQNKIITKTHLSVHHIEPIAVDYDRRLDEGNLITLCENCHALAERGFINKNILHNLAETSPGGV